MSNSINTNSGALIALQALNASSSDIQKTEIEISTGLKVSSATDNGATWAIAQNMRGTGAALTTVNDSLQRAKSAISVALAAGQQVLTALQQMNDLAVTAADPSLDPQSRITIATQYDELKTQISNTISTADFNGTNLLQSSAQFSFLDSADGSQRITVPGQSWSYTPNTPGPVIMLRGYSLDTTWASESLSEVAATLPNVEASLAALGSYSNQVDDSISFNTKLQDTLETGVGNLVDADVAQDSAKLTAQQTKQQLAAQSLSIANNAPSILLTLFSGRR